MMRIEATNQYCCRRSAAKGHCRPRHLCRAAGSATVLLAASLLTLVAALPVCSLELPGPLSRVHQDLVTGEEGCDSCHDDEMKVDGERCLACHDQVAERMRSKRGVHREVGVADCAVCHQEHQGADHDVRGFDTDGFDHAAETGFPLAGGHAPLVGNCLACHKSRSFLGNSPQCSSCHSDAHAGLLGETCTACHTSGIFRNASRAFHKGTRFPLEGRHIEVACADCHLDGVVAGTPTDCFDCHWIRRQDDRYRTRLGGQCEECHSPISWTAVRWEHEAATGFPLGTPHRRLPCDACHAGGNFEPGTPKDCYGCHRSDYEGTQDPPHLAAGFPTDCQLCHRPSDSSWQGGQFQHPFQLVGVHATLACSDCHAGGVYRGTPTDCVGCHLGDYQASTSPNHQAAGFPTDCTACHQATDQSFGEGRYPHSVFPLVGAHTQPECSDCHTGTVYQGLPSECVSCHLADYQGTTEPDHEAAGFPTTCELCHDPADGSWQGADFQHPYQLVGVHATLACSACHGGGVYQGTPTECVGCHLDNYQAATSPNHEAAGFPAVCDACHRATDQSFDEGRYSHGTWPLVGAHTQPECSDCHTGTIYQGLPSECVSCHLADYQGTIEPDHEAAGFPTTCELCHDPADGSWQGGAFQHPFQLVGVHATLACSACHAGGVYAGTPTDCVGCHLADYQASTSPNHQAAGFPTTCAGCHQATDQSFQEGRYPHSVWPLVGAHTQPECSDCHTGTVYQGLPSECVSCHLADYQGTTDPDHEAAGFPTTCELCHDPADGSWQGGAFQHPYQLVGVHATLACSACHAGGVYAGTPTDCVGCHLADYEASTSPNHQAAGFPTTCAGCHQATDQNFQAGRYPHSVWPLVGAHTQPACSDCHTGTVYQGLPSECVSCHLADYQGTTDPDHEAAGFPTTCQLCHDPADGSWQGGAFQHPFQLVGAHATVACSACHAGGVYQGTPTDCVGCHLADYQATTSPDHEAAGFPTTCQDCHDPIDGNWQGGDFQHVYQLVGVHATLACSACHGGGVYQGTPTECAGCHLDDYQAATSPDHAAAGFPAVCDACHHADDQSFQEGRYSHGTWPLVGAHAAPACSDCHTGTIYQGLPSECVTCHLANYQATTNPDHEAAGFPTTCQLCHDPADGNWQGGSFQHAYLLQGVHATLACSACHAGGVYQGTPTECVGCHLAAYQATTNPDHEAAGFPTTCDGCHLASDQSFQDGRYAHNVWPLVGAHTVPTCTNCHTGNVYQGLATECVSCHLGDYQATTNPNHQAVGYPPTCELCHDPADGTFSNTTFNHDVWFRTSSGQHSGWVCSSCHPVPADFSQFQCTTACHPQGETDSHHSGFSGYAYSSILCLGCHPSGDAPKIRRPRVGLRSSHARS